MDGELAFGDVEFAARCVIQAIGHFSAFARIDHPADDVAAEDIEDDLKNEVRPLGRSQQFGVVPTPELIGRGGQKLGLLVGRMGELVTAFA